MRACEKANSSGVLSGNMEYTAGKQVWILVSIMMAWIGAACPGGGL